MFASIPCSHTPIQDACVSLGGPGPMHSFNHVCENLLQTRYITQSVVYAMMWQVASTHGMPQPIGHICHHPPAKQTASHQQRGQLDSYFPAEIILARIWMEFSIIELLNPLKSVWHCKLPKRQTGRVSYTNFFCKGALFRGKGGPPVLEKPARHLPRQELHYLTTHY